MHKWTCPSAVISQVYAKWSIIHLAHIKINCWPFVQSDFVPSHFPKWSALLESRKTTKKKKSINHGIRKVEASQQRVLRKTRVNTWFYYLRSLPLQHLLWATKHSLGVRWCFWAATCTITQWWAMGVEAGPREVTRERWPKGYDKVTASSHCICSQVGGV